MHWKNCPSLTDLARERILALVKRKRRSQGGTLRLPSEAELCAKLGMSRITVRRAMDPLVASGDIVKHHGRGVFAVLKKNRAPRASGMLAGLLYRHDQINDYTGKIIAALDRAARRRGCRTAICTELGDLDSWKPGVGIPGPHGAISGYISNAFDLEQLAQLESRRIPTICLNNTRFLGRARYVLYEGPDNSTIPLEKLLSLGHGHLAYVGPNTNDPYLLKELAPFRHRLETEHPEVTLSLVHCGGELSDMAGTAGEIAGSSPPITGLLVYDDLIAAWLVRALQRLGRQVPRDVSVIAFNAFTDIRASLAVEPQISCMELRYDEIAEQAMDWFVRILEGAAPPRKRAATTRELIERGTTAMAPHAGPRGFQTAHKFAGQIKEAA
ncbi:MAG: substrate-binding domain-containing protein [Verrucomicrobia bacterium]|nr:substrate-binding domain-containing protein [Verrucomicrobiota bacterium]